jgi:hypothetical protein
MTTSSQVIPPCRPSGHLEDSSRSPLGIMARSLTL